MTETFATIRQWCDATFGPATWQRMIERAKEEFDELEATQAVEQAAIEAADVVICLCRIPGFDAALQAKMTVNRKRKWRLTGEGTGYHVVRAHIADEDEGDFIVRAIRSRIET